jgi:hypothetical protein
MIEHELADVADQLHREQVERVRRWRLQTLVEAGYPTIVAARLADSDTDLHEAVDLVTKRGCPPRLAARILAAL